jgi:hypothetical protein
MQTHQLQAYQGTRDPQLVKRGFASGNITAACKKRLRHVYGFYWRYADEFESIEKVLKENDERPNNVVRPVVMIDPVKRVAKRFPSIRAASKEGYDYNSVISALLGRSRRSGERYWRYAEDFVSVEAVLSEEAAYDADKKGATA